MEIKEAQSNMRQGYFGGAPGVATSAAMWLSAGLVAIVRSPQTAALVLLLGGMLIHPLAIVIARFLGRPGAHAKGNPLGALAFESTAILLLGVLLAFALSQFRVELFFPAMLLVIGGRYLTFQTLYGLPIYWVCGGVLSAAGLLAAVLRLPVAASAFAGGAVEAVFAVLIFSRMRLEAKS